MESLLIAVRVVVPMAMMVGIGVLLRLFRVTDAPTMKKVDNMIFQVFMPTLSFYNIYKTDFSKLQILFLGAMILIPKFVTPRPTAASYGQAIFRSNYLIFGAAVAESIYGAGNIGLVSLLGAVAVPLFNAQSAVLLETSRHGTASTKKLLLAIAKNPTVVATVLGIAVNLSGIILPELVLDVVQDLAGLTTPLSFLSIGVGLSLGGAVVKKWYLISASPAACGDSCNLCSHCYDARFPWAGNVRPADSVCCTYCSQQLPYGGRHGRRRRFCSSDGGVYYNFLPAYHLPLDASAQ